MKVTLEIEVNGDAQYMNLDDFVYTVTTALKRRYPMFWTKVLKKELELDTTPVEKALSEQTKVVAGLRAMKQAAAAQGFDLGGPQQPPAPLPQVPEERTTVDGPTHETEATPRDPAAVSRGTGGTSGEGEGSPERALPDPKGDDSVSGIGRPENPKA